MKDFIKTEFPPPILNQEGKGCISIYMPTHRTAPDNRQDLLRFKNIVKNLEDQNIYKKQVEKLRILEKSLDFWRYNTEGLAILLNEDDMNVYRLSRDVKEYVSIGHRFYLPPLIRNFQSDHNYYALGLSRDNFRLYSGNRYGFEEINIPDEERLLKHVIGDQQDAIRLNVASHGGQAGTFYSHSSKEAEVALDTEKFFNYVDKYIIDNYTKESQTPLILISLQEHQSTFRNLSKNPHLIKKGVVRSYESISKLELEKFIWDVLEPIYQQKTDVLVNQFNLGINNNTATNTIQSTLEAVLTQRARVLVIEADKRVYGNIDVEKMTFELDEDGSDILNHLAKLAIDNKVEVVVLPKDKMPAGVETFALLRY